jgi:hypothetical protein
VSKWGLDLWTNPPGKKGVDHPHTQRFSIHIRPAEQPRAQRILFIRVTVTGGGADVKYMSRIVLLHGVLWSVCVISAFSSWLLIAINSKHIRARIRLLWTLKSFLGYLHMVTEPATPNIIGPPVSLSPSAFSYSRYVRKRFFIVFLNI